MTAKAKTSKVKVKLNRPSLTRRDFIGLKMANFMFNIKQNSAIPENLREEARKLQEQWDSVCPFAYSFNNPISMLVLEKAFTSGNLGGDAATTKEK